MRITIPGFEGVNSLLAAQRIKETEAVDATDCDFRSGDLRGYLDDAQVMDGSTPRTTPSHDINGVTIFDYTPTQELVANGNWDVVRSPVVNDTYKRVYFSKYDPESTTNYVGIIESRNVQDQNGGLAVLSSTKRLGVPKPADIYIPPTYEIRQGDVTNFTVSTSSDAVIQIPSALAAKLKVGNKLIVSAPCFSTTPLLVNQIGTVGDSGSLVGIILGGNKKVIKSVVTKIVGQSNTITFVLNGHGLNANDQIALFRNKGTGSWVPVRNDNNKLTHWPTVDTGKVYTVATVTSNEFTIDLTLTANYEADKGVTTTHSGGVFVLLARAENWFPDATLARVNVVTSGPTNQAYLNFQQDAVNNGPPVGTWVDAAAIDTLRSRSYCITYVNSYGDESAPSTPTDPFDVVPGSPVTFGPNSFVISSGLSGWSMNDVTDLIEVRLYRTDETGTFRLVTTDSLSTDSTKYNIIKVYRTGTTQTIQTKSDGNIFVDKLTDAQLGEPLITTGWYPPPQGVQGIISAPNGVVAGFKGKTVYASVPYVPYAYPVAYQTATDADIMGLVTTGSGIAVLTNQMPYQMIGTDPSSWSMVKLEVAAACVSHASIVDMGTFGIYAGPDGLMAINGSEVRNLTQDMLTRAQWQEYNPTTIIGGHSEGRYVGSYLVGGTRKAFIFDTITNDFVDLSISAVGFYTDLRTDTLKFVDTAGNIKQWNRGTTTKSYFWKSKVFQLPMPSLFGAAQVVAYSYPVTFKLYDYDTGTQIGGSISVTAQNPFRLPSGARYQNLQITLEGTGSVATVAVSTSIGELKEI